MGAPVVRNSEEKFLEQIQIHGWLSSGVHDPLLRDFLLHLICAVQREQNFIQARHKCSVLLFLDGFASAVTAWQICQQLPIFAAYALKIWMVHNLEVQFLGHNVIFHEFYTDRDDLNHA